jgi:hypothetical protein
MGLGFHPRKLNGGKITGPGTGTSDSIDALADEGSFIMPADSTEKLGLGDDAKQSVQVLAQKLGLNQQQEPGLGFGGQKDVPIRVSNGEYMFSPEEVYQIGLALFATDRNHRSFQLPKLPDRPDTIRICRFRRDGQSYGWHGRMSLLKNSACFMGTIRLTRNGDSLNSLYPDFKASP